MAIPLNCSNWINTIIPHILLSFGCRVKWILSNIPPFFLSISCIHFLCDIGSEFMIVSVKKNANLINITWIGMLKMNLVWRHACHQVIFLVCLQLPEATFVWISILRGKCITLVSNINAIECKHYLIKNAMLFIEK